MVENDTQGSKQAFLLERHCYGDLVPNVQVLHSVPPRLEYDGEGPSNRCFFVTMTSTLQPFSAQPFNYWLIEAMGGVEKSLVEVAIAHQSLLKMPLVGHKSGDDISLIAHNGMLVVAEGGSGGVVNANSQRASHWQRFTLRNGVGSSGDRIRSGDTIALLARHGQDVVAEGGGREALANRDAPGPWEQFTVHMPDAAP
jgi:hypothetical protein